MIIEIEYVVIVMALVMLGTIQYALNKILVNTTEIKQLLNLLVNQLRK